MIGSTNIRKMRDAGYRARYRGEGRYANPFRAKGPEWFDLRAAWWDGWELAHGEHNVKQ